MAKVTNVMATEMALDVMKASTDLKALTQVVSANQSAWKAQTAALKSAGDYVGAYEAKVEGLGDSIKAQGAKLDALKDKQSDLGLETSKDAQKFAELKDKIDELKSKQLDLDQTTDEGKSKFKELGTQISELTEQQDKLSPATVKLAENYEKYQRQINQTEAQIVSLKAQQQRADSEVDLQKSGIIQLSSAVRDQNNLLNAQVEHMRVSGNEYSALKTHITGLQEQVTRLDEVYEKEQSLLESTKAKLGETSSEYIKQRTRVEQAGTAVSEARAKITELNEQLEKTPHGFLDGVSSKLDSVRDKADKTSNLFGKMFMANVAANLFTNTLASIQAHFTSLIEAGNEYNIEQDKMNATWLTLTGNASKGKAMVNTINELSVKTGQSTDLVNELEQGFYHLNSSKKQADGLTKSMLNMGDAVGLTGDQMKAVGQDMVHSMATGKLTAGELNQIGSYFPMIDEALAKHYNTTVAGMRKIVKSGKVTSATLQQVFEQLGNGKYDKAAQNMLQTVYGMTRTIKAQAPKLVADLEGPFETMRNPILGQVSKWVTDKSTQTLMSNFGKNIMTQFNRVVAAYGGKKINVTAGLDGAVKSASKMVTNFANLLIRHKKDIKEFFDSFKTGGATSFKIFVGVLKDMAIALKPLLDLMAKFPRTSAAMITSGLLISKTIKGIQLAVIGASAIKSFGSIIAFKDAESGAVKLGALGKAVKLFGQSFMTVGKFMLTNPFGIAITAAALLAVGFAELYNHSKTFRDAMNKLGNTLKNVFTGSIKWVAEWGRNMKKGWSDAKTSTSKGVKDVGRFISNLVTSAGKNLSNLWNGTKSTFRNGWTDVTNASKSGAHNVDNWFGNMANDTRKTAIKMFNDHKATFRSGYDVLNNYTQVWHDVMTGKWNKVGSDLKNTANSIRSLVHNIFSDMYNNLNNMTGGRLGDMVNAWKSKMSAIGNTVSDAKESIHKHFVDLVRGIIKPFNDMLSGLEKGINWVLDKVGASKISGDWSVPMPSYAQGTKDTHQGGLAKVNDGQDANYREMYHLPNGEIGMFPAVKNMIVPLPKGTSVLDGNKSAQLAKAMGIPGYASGIGDFFSGLWSGTKDVLDDTEDILKKPAEFMESLFNHFLGNTSSKISLANDILTHFPKTLANDAVKWVKKMFNTLNNTLDSNASGPKATGDHLHWLKQAGVPDSWTSSMSWLINAESGWNPHARNGSSGAYGIPQSLPASKLASAGKDWKDNPITQIKWMVNYIKGRYGTAMAAESFHKRVGWYANGGIATTPSIFGEAGAEMAIPLNTMSSSRAWQLLGQVVDYYRGGGTNSTNATTNNADVVAELKSVKSYLAALVGLGTDQITATKGIVGYDSSRVYRQQATDKKLAGFQSFG